MNARTIWEKSQPNGGKGEGNIRIHVSKGVRQKRNKKKKKEKRKLTVDGNLTKGSSRVPGEKQKALRTEEDGIFKKKSSSRKNGTR